MSGPAVTSSCSSRVIRLTDCALTPKAAPIGWAAVVRPDRVVLADGPAGAAAELVLAALDLMGEKGGRVG